MRMVGIVVLGNVSEYASWTACLSTFPLAELPLGFCKDFRKALARHPQGPCEALVVLPSDFRIAFACFKNAFTLHLADTWPSHFNTKNTAFTFRLASILRFGEAREIATS